MQTVHLHNGKINNDLSTLLLLIPIFVFGITILVYLIMKSHTLNPQLATESSSYIGVSEEDTRVLGKQDTQDDLDIEKVQLVK